MKKIKYYILVLIIIVGLIGCSSNDESNDLAIFDMPKAKEVAIDYIEYLSKGDIEKANEICVKELIDKENFEQFNELMFNGYKIIDDLEGSDHLILTVDASRMKNDHHRSDLDRVNIKVIDTEDGYKISEIKAEMRGEVFEEEGKLRIIKYEDGSSKLLLRKKDVPEDVYPKEEGQTLRKLKVPEGDFGTVTLGYERNTVAFTIVGEDGTFVGMATVQEAKETIGANTGKGEGEPQDASKGTEGINLDELIEKPIADKIAGYDLVNGAKVEKMTFTQDDGQLIVQYRKGDVNFIRVYTNLEGGLLNLDLEKNFPKEEYNVKVDEIKKDEIIINVSSLGEKTEKDGQYSVEIKKAAVTKR